MFREVPVLPVVVPLAGVVFAALTWRLHRRGSLTAARASVALAICVYVAGVVANTVFPIFLDKPARTSRWTDFVHLMPLSDYELADAVMNICVFVPVGVLVPLILRRSSWGRVLGVAAAFSLGIEMTQYVTAHLLGGGHVADVNDLLFNVVGAACGLVLLATVSRVPVIARVMDRFHCSRADDRSPAQHPA